MATRTAALPALPPSPCPRSLDAFAAVCLDAVLARARGDDRRRRNGKAQRGKKTEKKDP